MSIFMAWGSRFSLKAAPRRRAISMAARKKRRCPSFSGEDAEGDGKVGFADPRGGGHTLPRMALK